MRATPNVCRRMAIIVNPITNAASPPDGDRDPLRIPLDPRYSARKNGPNGNSEKFMFVRIEECGVYV